MTPSSVGHLPSVVIFSIFTGYQLAIQMEINVVAFSIFHIATRDVPHYDQPRCFVPIPSGAHDPNSMFNGRSDLPQSCSIMAHSPVGLLQGSCLYTSARELMRWLTALHVLCFVKHNMIPSKKETAPGTTANSGTYLLQPHRTPAADTNHHGYLH